MVFALQQPGLQRADLRDGVLNVVEGRMEEVPLPVPEVCEIIVHVTPVDVGGEAAGKVNPFLAALIA